MIPTSRRTRVCHYCGKKTLTTWDHIVPRSMKGTNSRLNRVRCCGPCNAKKGSKWPTHDCGVCRRAIAYYKEKRPQLFKRYAPPASI